MTKQNINTTSEMLENLKSPKGGYTREAVESIGIDWPLKKGWKRKLITANQMYSDKPVLLDSLVTLIAQHRIIHRFNSIEIAGFPFNNNQAALFFLKIIPECLEDERIVRLKMPRSIQYGYKFPYYERAVFYLIKFLALNDAEKSAIIYCFNELGIIWHGQFATETIPGRKQSAEQLFNKAVKLETGASVIDSLKKRLIG